MNALAKFVVERQLLAWLLALCGIGLAGWLSGHEVRSEREHDRLARLENEARRGAIEIMSYTLNGNLMGSVAMLGITSQDFKAEAKGLQPANNLKVLPVLESIGRSYDADGVFMVAENGVIGSSWDNSGKPSTGLNVKFRPYYQMAMQGLENVYAAVSLARGDRSLYFAVPIFREETSGTDSIGAVVARTGLLKVDAVLRDKADIALLLSPQGVVFAGSRAEWVGHMAGQPTPERLKAIRELKQFGNLFESKEPALLPVSVETGVQDADGRRYAVSSASVQWNDPFGDWKLVLFEDLGRTVPLAGWASVGGSVALALLVIASLLLAMLKSQYRQTATALQLEVYARQQTNSAERKTRIAAATVRLQRTTTRAELVRDFLDECHALFGALQGVVYLDPEGDNVFRLAGSFACAEPPPAELTPGQGLLGQCMLEGITQVVTVQTEGYAMIRSGLGDAVPAATLMLPVRLSDRLLGAVEIAVPARLDAFAQAELEELVALLAMNVEIVGRSEAAALHLAATRDAERAGQEQVAFQQALIDAIPFPVFYKDAGSRYLGVNRAYEAAFGVRREDIVGKRISELDGHLSADRRTAYQAEHESLIAEAGSVEREVQSTLADGARHDLHYFAAGFRRADGSPGGMVGSLIDISDLKQAERELDRLADVERFNRLARDREQRVLELKREVNQLAEAAGQPARYSTDLVETVDDHLFERHPDYDTRLTFDGRQLRLDDLVDMTELQRLFTAFCDAVGVPAAIIDLEAKVLASSRWQRACTDFHRVNPESCARCIESDTELALKLKEGQDFTMYQCKNGMTDCASPIIVEGQHLANVFIGQFHLQPPDRAFFAEQARKFGYDEAEYLKAVAEAPLMDERRLPAILGFLTGFARMVSTMSLARLRADAAQARLEEQALLLKRERVAALSLAEDAERARRGAAQADTEPPGKERAP